MRCIDRVRRQLVTFLEGEEAAQAQRAIASAGAEPSVMAGWLEEVTEAEGSVTRCVAVVRRARELGLPESSVAIERWLLAWRALDVLDSPPLRRLGPSALRLTCDEIASFFADDDATIKALRVTGPRFREFAKIVTGRRFCAGMFHWEESGIPRSWLLKVPAPDWLRFGRAVVKAGGLGPMMFTHLNPRRASARLEEPGLSLCYAVLAEAIALRPDLLGVVAASWFRSPDTHRVSPRLAVVNAPILGSGGVVTTVGRAPLDCGVFARSETRKRLYEEGQFTPTIGLALWPRDALLAWHRSHPEIIPAEAA